jgi:hypothetical protein
MKKMFRCLTLAAAALWCGTSAHAQQPDELANHLARQAETYREVFDRLSSPDVSQAVLEGLASRDPQVFEALGDGLDVHDALRCSWVKGAVETLLKRPWKMVDTCTLKDLTPDQFATYLAIVLRFYEPMVHEGSMEAFTAAGGAIGIPPGPFLIALQEKDLVDCNPSPSYDTALQVPLTTVLRTYCYE